MSLFGMSFLGPMLRAAARSISIPHSNPPGHQFIHKPSPGSQSFTHPALCRPVDKIPVIMNLKSILNLFLPSQTLIGTTRTHTTRTVEHDIVRLIIRNQPPVLPIIHPCLFHNRSMFLLKRLWGGSTGSRYLSCCAGKRKPSLEE